ncbi:hypothetical protein NQ315_011372 [Exocentrus adspersus]|uniref:Retrotransposon gag domain-containing protein n=1 Tax=Exocentrus adspersus TaxID=1586481 RepID=A0AAV8VBN7_9CUCU|nr:hypothetical protein NQ315_011372 [Exocentrus adspersus]
MGSWHARVTLEIKKPETIGQPQANSTLTVPLIRLEDEETTEEEGETGPVPGRRVIHPVIESTDYTTDEDVQQVTVRMANTTLREAIDNGRTPSTPKFISPTTFNPATGNALTYIRAYDRTAVANGWTDAYKINYFGSFLEGAAGIWYEEYKGEAGNANKTWQQITNDFCAEFAGPNHMKLAKSKFANRRQQDGEDIKDTTLTS